MASSVSSRAEPVVVEPQCESMREFAALTLRRAGACLCPGSRRRFVRSCRSMDFDVVEPGRPGGVSV